MKNISERMAIQQCLSELKIGQVLQCRRKFQLQIHSMAAKAEISVSSQKINETEIQVTRIA